MRNPTVPSLVALTMLAPLAMANGGGDDLDRVQVPALKNVTVTAKPGKGVTFDAGDDFKLTIYNRIQVQFRWSELDVDSNAAAGVTATVNTFRVRRARTKFKGHAFSPKTTYQLYLEWATGGNNILDAWIQQHLWSNDQWSLHLRGGAGKTQYGREATGTSSSLEFVERSIAARTFTGARSTGLVAMASGELGQNAVLNAHLGVWNSDTAAGSTVSGGPNSLNADGELNYTAGARVDINGDMGGESYTQGDLEHHQDLNGSIGANVWIGNEGGLTTPDVDVLAFNVNGAAKYKGIHALAEFFMHNTEPDVPGSQSNDNTGWNLQGSFTTQTGWGFGGRVSGVSIDNSGIPGLFPPSGGATGGGTGLGIPAAGTPSGDVMEFSVGVSKYFNGHGRKVQADLTFQQVDNDAAALQDQDNIIFRIMATLGI